MTKQPPASTTTTKQPPPQPTKTTQQQQRHRKLPKRQSMTLKDGRKLAYIIDGPSASDDNDNKSSSLPYIFCFHAMFLSHKAFWMKSMAPQDYILVSLDRPGYFGSDAPKNGYYSYELFAKDVEQLANHMDVAKFSVVGHSSGGPYALACAAFLPDRVTSIGLLASDVEYASDKVPADAQTGPLFDCMMGCCLPKLMWFAGPCYRVHQGLKQDFVMERLPYPFATEDISQPALVVLAEKDTILARDVAIWTHRRLPNSQLKEVEGVGHMDLLRDDILDDTFRAVVELAQSSSSLEPAVVGEGQQLNGGEEEEPVLPENGEASEEGEEIHESPQKASPPPNALQTDSITKKEDEEEDDNNKKDDEEDTTLEKKTGPASSTRSSSKEENEEASETEEPQEEKTNKATNEP